MPILALLFLTLIALAWGDALLRRLDSSIHGLQRFVFAQALGLGLFAFLVFALGWIAWNPVVAWGLLALLAGPGLARARLIRYREKLPVLGQRLKYWKEQLTRLDMALLISLAIIFSLFFLQAFSPVIGWDASTHHYVLPQRYLEVGRVHPVREIIFGNYPALVHNLYAWMFALGGVAAAGLLNWYVALLVTILIYSYGRTLHSRTAGLISALIFMSAPTMGWITTAGYIDLYMVLYLLAGIVAWEHHRREERPGLPWVAALLFGCSLGTKHLAILYCLIIGIARVLTDRLKKSSWSEVAQVAGIAIAIGAPWFIRSWIVSGNPIDPFLPKFFDPNYVVTNPVSVNSWSQPTLQRSTWLLLTWPWRFVIDFTLIGAWYRALMPLPLALLPLPLWYREARARTPGMTFFWIIVILFAIFAFLKIPGNTRYALPAWALLCWMTGIIAGELVLRPLWRLKLIPLLLGPPVLILSLLLVKDLVEVLPAIASPARYQTIMEDRFPGFGAFSWSNDNLPLDAKVLCVDPRLYFLERDGIVGDPGNESHLAPPWTLNDTHNVLEHLRADGITHILVNETPAWHPEGRYLYELLWHVEQEGLTIQTPEQASIWSGTYVGLDGNRKPYMDEGLTRHYMQISRVDILPNADGRGHPGAVVRPDWIRGINGGNRLPLMQGHLAAMTPILTELYAEQNMRVFAIDWAAYDRGVAIDDARTLTWLFQGLPMPEEVARKQAARQRELEPRIVPFGQYIRDAGSDAFPQ